MSEHAVSPLTAAAFPVWQRGQALRHELVDGQPVAMAGAQIRHDRVTINAIMEIGRQRRAGTTGCDVFTADIGIRTPAGNIRRPELSVLCPPFDEAAMLSDRPRLVVEVLSDSTGRVARFVKPDEYKSIAAPDYILLVDPRHHDVGFWFRDAQRAWQGRVLSDPHGLVEMPALGLRLDLASLYIGLAAAAPRRAQVGPGA
jgi:Uma2 family endonuclease